MLVLVDVDDDDAICLKRDDQHGMEMGDLLKQDDRKGRLALYEQDMDHFIVADTSVCS